MFYSQHLSTNQNPELSSAVKNKQTNKFVKVLVSSSSAVLGPPELNVTVVENKLRVKLSGPFRWRDPGKKRQSMFSIFPHMVYNISVHNNSSSSRRTVGLRSPAFNIVTVTLP